jgi:hypothetical protein
MSPAQYLQDLEERGIRLKYKLIIQAPSTPLQSQDRDKLQQLKPLLVKLLAENDLTALVAEDLDTQQPTTPKASNTRLYMVDNNGRVTNKIDHCYMWTRQQLGYGCWYASDYPPPLT